MLLLIANVAIWLIERWSYRTHGLVLDRYFALSVDGLRHGYIWQLLTYQFLHAVPAPWHLLFNSWAIFVFGSEVEFALGKKRMLQLYFLSGIVGGLFQMLGMWLLPGLFGEGGTVGASACAFGLVAAFAVLYPNERIFLLLFFVIPLKMRATTLLRLSFALTIFGILFPILRAHVRFLSLADPLFAGIGHAAHLGGIIAGFLLARRMLRGLPGKRVAPPPHYETVTKSSLNMSPASD